MPLTAKCTITDILRSKTESCEPKSSLKMLAQFVYFFYCMSYIHVCVLYTIYIRKKQPFLLRTL